MYQKTSGNRWNFNEHVSINLYEDDEEKKILI